MSEKEFLYGIHIDAAPEEMGEKPKLPPEELTQRRELSHGFIEGLFDENNEELFTIAVKRRGKTQINVMSTLGEFEKEFMLSREAKGATKGTLKAYKDNFNRLYRFVHYANTMTEKQRDNLRRMNDKFIELGQEPKDALGVGRMSPLLILRTDNLAAYFRNCRS